MLTFMVPQYKSPSTRAIQRHPASRPSQDLALTYYNSVNYAARA